MATSRAGAFASIVASFATASMPLVSVPIGMRRPTTAREALLFSPTLKAGGAHASGVECVPLVATSARPEVVLTRRPAAVGTADARAGSIAALVKSGIAFYDCGQHGAPAERIIAFVRHSAA
jgi:hypothetical protein